MILQDTFHILKLLFHYKILLGISSTFYNLLKNKYLVHILYKNYILLLNKFQLDKLYNLMNLLY